MKRVIPPRWSLLQQLRSGSAGPGLPRMLEARRAARRGRLPHGPVGAIAAPVLLLVAFAGEGIAQDAAEPLRLIPSHEVEVEEVPGPAPDEAAPAADPQTVIEEEAADSPEAPTAAPGEDGIVVGALAAIDADAGGVAVPGIEPFPNDLWSGSRRARVEALLPRLPALVTSAAMRRLAVALLASPAQTPAGEGEPGSFVLSRAERLAAMGRRELAITLLERAGPPDGPGVIARLRTERALAALDYDAACEGIASKAGRTGDGFWRRVRILCQARAGLVEAATLGLDLLSESGVPPDPLFDDTIYAMAGLAEPAPERLDEPTPLRVAAWRLAQIPIPVEAVVTAAPDVLPAIVGARESPLESRLLAAERAWATGALSIEAVRDLYLGMAFSPDERADALEQMEDLEPVLARALLFQSIEAQTVPALRAELLAAALANAEAHGGYALMAHALADQVRTVPQMPEHGWFGGTAGRALLAAGDRDAAAAWYALANEQGPRDPEAARSALRLRPLMLLRDDGGHLTASDFDAWLALTLGEVEPHRTVAHASWLVILLDALGGRIDPEVWDRLLVDERPAVPRTGAPVLAHGLRAAAAEGRLGETVLMALLLLGEGGPATHDPTIVGTVVSSLVSAGLPQEARAIALEAALEEGL